MLFPLLAALVGVTLFYTGSSTEIKSIPELPGLLVPQSTGKERQIVSMTHDASMYTERKRRSAIMAVHSCQPESTCVYSGTCGNKTLKCTGIPSNKIRETRTMIGSAGGAMEAYMLTSICNTKYIPEYVLPPPPITEIYDGGTPSDDFQDIADGGAPSMDHDLYTQYYDGGGPMTSSVNVFDGLDPLSNIMKIVYSQLDKIPILDGGNPDTNVC